MVTILGIVGSPNKDGRTNQMVRKVLAGDASASGLAFKTTRKAGGLQIAGWPQKD